MIEEIQKLVVFQKKEIRRQLYKGEWWFVITDVIVALTGSTDPAQYLRKLRARDEEIAQLFEADSVDKGTVQIVPSLRLPRSNFQLGQFYEMMGKITIDAPLSNFKIGYSPLRQGGDSNL